MRDKKALYSLALCEKSPYTSFLIALAEIKEFSENKEGVHLMSGLNAEYSVCGMAFDAGSTNDNEDGDLIKTDKKIVTCPNCIIEIKNCRNVKTQG